MFVKENIAKFELQFSLQVLEAIHTCGLEELRPLQREAINATLAGRDCFVIMPTGKDKKLLMYFYPLSLVFVLQYNL